MAYWQVTDPDNVWSVTRNNRVDNVLNYAFIFDKAEPLAITFTLVVLSLNLV